MPGGTASPRRCWAGTWRGSPSWSTAIRSKRKTSTAPEDSPSDAATASVTLIKEEADPLQLSLGPGKRLTDIAPFDIAVSYDYLTKIYKDRIRNAEFTGRSVEVKQNDKVIATKFELIVSHIDWNIL